MDTCTHECIHMSTQTHIHTKHIHFKNLSLKMIMYRIRMDAEDVKARGSSSWKALVWCETGHGCRISRQVVAFYVCWRLGSISHEYEWFGAINPPWGFLGWGASPLWSIIPLFQYKPVDREDENVEFLPALKWCGRLVSMPQIVPLSALSPFGCLGETFAIFSCEDGFLESLAHALYIWGNKCQFICACLIFIKLKCCI